MVQVDTKVLSFINILLGLTLMVLQLRYYLWLTRRKVNTWRWLELYTSGVGLVWAGLSTTFLFSNLQLSAAGRVILLPTVTATLGMLVASAIISSKRIR